MHYIKMKRLELTDLSDTKAQGKNLLAHLSVV